jgi:hypothetical protein
MREVKVETVISVPREEIYDFVADLSRRPAYSDHYLKDYRLARANPVGRGAAARFLLDAPIFSERGELSIAVADRPRRIVEEGRVGRLGRSRMVAVYDFISEPGGSTRVELTTHTEPKTALDRFKHRRVHRWMGRQSETALERLRKIFEEPGGQELARATVAGVEPGRAPRFGARVGTAREGTVRCSPENYPSGARPIREGPVLAGTTFRLRSSPGDRPALLRLPSGCAPPGDATVIYG